MQETICDVCWDGPFEWDKRNLLRNSAHVLYAIYGNHSIYGQNVLLYIGMTETTVADRLAQHTWLRDEYDRVTIKIVSIGVHPNVESWWAAWDSMSETDVYPRPTLEIIRAVEALLIYAHQPAYNTMGKGSLSVIKQLRIFDTGKCGSLLPELSYAYYKE
ncbi:MAG: hypothetical protein ACREOH_06690 [Candidatus Entotheonellia bacterium]